MSLEQEPLEAQFSTEVQQKTAEDQRQVSAEIRQSLDELFKNLKHK